MNSLMIDGWVMSCSVSYSTLVLCRCVSGTDILQDWTSEINRLGVVSAGLGGTGASSPAVGGKKLKLIRPHVLKVDVEGHDYGEEKMVVCSVIVRRRCDVMVRRRCDVM